jgi:uncharacterized membrane protein
LPHGFLYQDGVFQLIEPPGAISSGAFGINNRGQIVGDYTDARGTHGFLDTGGTLQTIDVPGFEGRTFTRGINRTGHITGSIREKTGFSHGYLGTPVPEPPTLVLFGIGLVVVCIAGRRVQ